MGAKELAILLITIFVVSTMAGCGGGVTTPNSPPVVRPLAINHQPASLTVSVGQTAMFTVEADGQTPLIYRWTKNGEVIQGAISNRYTTTPPAMADSAAHFH